MSTIRHDPPLLNWIYVDKDTHEVKYGTRAETEGHFLGPWDCTPIDKRLIFQEWEGFVVVKEQSDGDSQWALYFDVDDDGLFNSIDRNSAFLEVELIRKEMRVPPVVDEDDGPD